MDTAPAPFMRFLAHDQRDFDRKKKQRYHQAQSLSGWWKKRIDIRNAAYTEKGRVM